MDRKAVSGDPEDISLVDLFKGFQKAYRLLKSKKTFLLFWSLLVAFILFGISWLSKPQYKAELSFVLEEESKSSIGGYAALASQFGFNIGSSSSASGVFSGDNLIELLKSRFLIEKTLLTPVELDNGEKILLVNYYININKLREKWASHEELKNLQFNERTSGEKLTRVQDSILNCWYNSISNSLSVDRKNPKLSIINVSFSDENERFAKYFCETLVNTASRLYKETKTKKFQAVIDFLQYRTDSVKNLFEQKQDALARLKDENESLSKAEARVDMDRKQREVTMLETMYTELFKNLEANKTSLIKETPVIQTIDTPALPLEKIKKSKRMYGLGGFILGGILASVYILAKEFAYLPLKKRLAETPL